METNHRGIPYGTVVQIWGLRETNRKIGKSPERAVFPGGALAGRLQSLNGGQIFLRKVAFVSGELWLREYQDTPRSDL